MEYKSGINWTPYLATAFCEGFGAGEGASSDEQLEAWQYMYDNNLAWNRQGWYGRTLEHLIQLGLIDTENKNKL
tara:strand:+ start:2684 stop:2905 length:222 start_codon:yes stop_codon:yes gene_type:complete